MTTQQIANSITYGTSWDFKNLTYSFKDTRLPYELDEDFQGSYSPSNAMKIATNKILDYVETILDLNFTYTTGIGDIVFSYKQMQDPNTIGYTYLPGTHAKNAAGDVYISASFSDADFEVGGLGYSTLVHELGHALGLQHPYGSGYYPGVDIYDTVMSYNNYQTYDNFNNHSVDLSSFITYQSADILALQSIYGENTETKDNFYDFESMLLTSKIDGLTGPIEDSLYTLEDRGGIDTISLQNIHSSYDQYIDINPTKESIISINDIHNYVTITADTTVENVIGSTSDDKIILNQANNIVDGLSGFDSIYIDTKADVRVDKLQEKTIVSGKDSGFDTLTNVEAIYINYDQIDTNLYQRETFSTPHLEEAKQISRLYLSALDRLADEDGLNYWLNQYTTTHDIHSIANSFIESDEFKETYQDKTDDKSYISLLYNNVLYRDADADGLNYWLHDMQAGATKADILISFATSAEFIGLTGVYFEGDALYIL